MWNRIQTSNRFCYKEVIKSEKSKINNRAMGHLHKDYDEIFEISLKQQEERERIAKIVGNFKGADK